MLSAAGAQWPPRHPGTAVEAARGRARFASVLVLSKREAFEVCEACAEAERALLRAGRAIEAARLAAVFELVEGRLVSYDHD